MHVVLLYIVSYGYGLTPIHIKILANQLNVDEDYRFIELHENNLSAYGFISSSYYHEYDYNSERIAVQMHEIIGDWTLLSYHNEYTISDNKTFLIYCER